MTKFKVGDIVIGNKLADCYGITDKGWKGQVLEIDEDDVDSEGDICVKGFTEKEIYWVDSACFDLYQEEPCDIEVGTLDGVDYPISMDRDNSVNPFPSIMKDKEDSKDMVNVSVDFIKQAYQMADPDLRCVMEQEFEDLFKKEQEPFNFGKECTLGTSWSVPLMIGHGLAPKGLKGRCLIVRSDYDLEVTEYNDFKVLIFRKNK
jgi:hypothetical protein